jgi:hypothetical protein
VGAIDKPATTGVDSQAQNLAGFRPGGLAFFSWNTDASSGTKDSAWLVVQRRGRQLAPNQRATFFQDVIDGPSGFATATARGVRQGTSGTGVTNGKVSFLAQGGLPGGLAGGGSRLHLQRVVREADRGGRRRQPHRPRLHARLDDEPEHAQPPTGILNMPGQQDALSHLPRHRTDPPVTHTARSASPWT